MHGPQGIISRAKTAYVVALGAWIALDPDFVFSIQCSALVASILNAFGLDQHQVNFTGSMGFVLDAVRHDVDISWSKCHRAITEVYAELTMRDLSW